MKDRKPAKYDPTAAKRKLRETRDRNKECRVCGKPAKVDPKTGTACKACDFHLRVDRERKESQVHPLSWDRHRAATPRERIVPLPWRK